MERPGRGLSGDTRNTDDTGDSWLSIVGVCASSDSAIRESQRHAAPGEKFVRQLPAYQSRFELMVALDVAVQKDSLAYGV